MDQQLLAILDEIRAIAQLGLNYTKDSYDKERYETLLAIASREYGNASELDDEFVKQLLRKELGYITPKVGVNGIIIQNNMVLLEKRSDDGTWGIPGGWAEVGESPQESLKREFWEETSLNIEVNELVDVFTRRPGDHGFPHSSIHLLFYCSVKGGDLKKSFESQELGFFDYKTITNWHRDHFVMVDEAMKKLSIKLNP